MKIRHFQELKELELKHKASVKEFQAKFDNGSRAVVKENGEGQREQKINESRLKALFQCYHLEVLTICGVFYSFLQSFHHFAFGFKFYMPYNL